MEKHCGYIALIVVFFVARHEKSMAGPDSRAETHGTSRYLPQYVQQKSFGLLRQILQE
jgi:hypothetical protein